jgi:hypothetical protein
MLSEQCQFRELAVVVFRTAIFDRHILAPAHLSQALPEGDNAGGRDRTYDVRFWHLADMARGPTNVRFGG